MKIGIFLPNATFDLPGSPEVGGIETFAYTIGETLQRLGHDVILFGGEPKPGRQHRQTTIQLRLFPYWETKSIPDIGTRFQRLIQRLHFAWVSRHAWRNEHIDLALISKPFDWPIAWLWKRAKPDLRVVMGYQGTDFFAGDTLFYSAVDRAFAVSPYVADLAEKHTHHRPAVIPNPVDSQFFTPAQPTPPAPSPEPFRLAATGRIVGWKGFHQLIEAVARLRARHIPVTCRLAGEGPELDALKELIAHHQLESSFTLCGRLDRDGLRELLHQADAYVAPSIGMEAFSIAALEAASMGLPLLLTDRIGLGEFLDSTDFISYPAEDIDALARGIETLIGRRTDPQWTDRAARHERMRLLFSPEVVALKILNLASAYT